MLFLVRHRRRLTLTSPFSQRVPERRAHSDHAWKQLNSEVGDRGASESGGSLGGARIFRHEMSLSEAVHSSAQNLVPSGACGYELHFRSFEAVGDTHRPMVLTKHQRAIAHKLATQGPRRTAQRPVY